MGDIAREAVGPKLGEIIEEVSDQHLMTKILSIDQ